MKQYVKRTQCDYSLYFKLAVVEQVEKGEMTYRQGLPVYEDKPSGVVSGMSARAA